MFRKYFLLILVCVLILPVGAISAEPTESQAEFQDKVLEAPGMVEGYPDTEFKGDRIFTRYEASMVLARMWIRMMNEVMKDTPFSDWQSWEASLPVETWLTDLNSSHWAYGGVSILETLGISIGYPDGTYKGQNQITRAELAILLERLYKQFEFAMDESKLSEFTEESISDMDRLFEDVTPEHWAYNHIANLYILGLIDIDSDGKYRPKDTMTRYEMAVDMERYLTRVLELLNK